MKELAIETMRPIILILIILVYTQAIHGQTESLTDRLYTEVTTSYSVQSKYIGCYGNLSTLYKKVDTLRNAVGLNAFIDYFDKPSVNLKYYAFIEIMASDEKRAFEKLTEISNNSDLISFEFAGQFGGQVRLLELLTGEYLGFVKMKYYYGRGCTYHDRSYWFEKKNRRVWRQKKDSISKFIAVNGLSKKWIENYIP